MSRYVIERMDDLGWSEVDVLYTLRSTTRRLIDLREQHPRHVFRVVCDIDFARGHTYRCILKPDELEEYA